MAITVYTRTLPDLTRPTRRAVYRRLALLIEHTEALGVDLISFTVDAATREVTITLTDPVPAGHIGHLELGP